MAIYNTVPTPVEEDALLETTSKPKSLKRIVAGAAAVLRSARIPRRLRADHRVDFHAIDAAFARWRGHAVDAADPPRHRRDVSFVLGALAATAITAKDVQTNNFPMFAQNPGHHIKKLVKDMPGIEASTPSDWKYWAKWNKQFDQATYMHQWIGPYNTMGIETDTAMVVTVTEPMYIYHAYGVGTNYDDPRFQGDSPGAVFFAFEESVDGQTQEQYMQNMQICDGWLKGNKVMRCLVEPGFQAIVGVGAPIQAHKDDPEFVAGREANFGEKTADEIDADFEVSCHGKAMMSAPKINGHDQMQVLVALYDTTSPGPGIDNDLPVYVPHVQRCEFCPTNKENVLASFDHVHKQCEVDKHLKNGLLTHKVGPISDGE